jgi:hypothetical protein
MNGNSYVSRLNRISGATSGPQVLQRFVHEKTGLIVLIGPVSELPSILALTQVTPYPSRR